jgi:uncharacterized protein
MSRPIVFLLALLFAAQNVFALAIAPPTGHVNDRAGILDASTVRLIESFLTDFERRESTQIAVLTVPYLGGQTIEDFSLAVAQQWGIGQKKKDNGLLLLVAKEERGIRIEVGSGLEGRLTDLTTGRIIRNVITPAFREGNFNRGVSRGVEAMALAVRGEYQDDRDSSSRSALNINYGGTLFVLCVGGLFLFIWFMLVLPIERSENKARATVSAAFVFAFVTFVLTLLISNSTINWLVVGLTTAAGALGGLLAAVFDLPGRWGWVERRDSLGSGGFSGGSASGRW